MNKLFFSFFLLGLSFGIGPCLASCGPLLISYVAATNKNITKSILVYILFSLSRILVYIVLSLFIFLFGQIMSKYVLGSFSKYLFIFGGMFLVIIGILICFRKGIDNKFCQKLQKFFLKKDTKTVIMLGLIIGILPCTPLISVISYIGLVSKHWLNAISFGLSFGLGTIISPLFLLVLFAGLISRVVLNGNSPHYIFNFFCGLIIVFLGFQLMSRAF